MVAALVVGVAADPLPIVAAPLAMGAVSRRYPWLTGNALSPWPLSCTFRVSCIIRVTFQAYPGQDTLPWYLAAGPGHEPTP